MQKVFLINRNVPVGLELADNSDANLWSILYVKSVIEMGVAALDDTRQIDGKAWRRPMTITETCNLALDLPFIIRAQGCQVISMMRNGLQGTPQHSSNAVNKNVAKGL